MSRIDLDHIRRIAAGLAEAEKLADPYQNASRIEPGRLMLELLEEVERLKKEPGDTQGGSAMIDLESARKQFQALADAKAKATVGCWQIGTAGPYADHGHGSSSSLKLDQWNANTDYVCSARNSDIERLGLELVRELEAKRASQPVLRVAANKYHAGQVRACDSGELLSRREELRVAESELEAIAEWCSGLMDGAKGTALELVKQLVNHQAKLLEEAEAENARRIHGNAAELVLRVQQERERAAGIADRFAQAIRNPGEAK